MYSILVLAEDVLTPHDVARIAQLHGDEPVAVRVLIPVERHARRLVEALDEVALGRLGGGHGPAGEAGSRARAALEASVAALTGVGIQAEGALVGDDPVAETIAAAASADEVLVVTHPHLVEETLHRDWASRLREGAGRPVLHVVAGTDRVVS